MPTPMDAMLGLVVAAVGLLTFVIALSMGDPKKQKIAYGISIIITVLGLFYYVSAEMRGFQMRRRIANLQRQQQVNLEEIQKRLQETQAKTPAPEAPVTPKAPAASRRK